MLKIDRQKLDAVLALKGLTIQELARSCGISRQSIYQMFRDRSVFNKPFEKILKSLNVDFSELITTKSAGNEFMADAPESVKKMTMALIEYGNEHGADVLLFGSRARRKKTIKADWDFGIYFPSGNVPKGFASLKEKLKDQAFPYRADIVVLNNAPEWFLRSIEDDVVTLAGSTPLALIFGRRAA